jgi:cation diffusion facilitator CzcD-associated flavoprotein CzcO
MAVGTEPGSTDAVSTEPVSPGAAGTRVAKVVIIGSGFSGLGIARQLRKSGVDDLVILERSDDVGGVWQLNTYPGCTCDVPSNLYSFSFAPNPDWSSTYSPQPEIRRYLQNCVDRFGLRSVLRTGVEVTGASWREDDQRWEIQTSEGVWIAQVLVSAVGPLTEPKLPAVAGIEKFRGKIMHSARWDHDYDLRGKRVASIGTGASAIQYVPTIADDVAELFVFQRTPPWIIPHDKRPITDTERERYRRFPLAQRLSRSAVYVSKEALLPGFAKRPALMRLPAGIARSHLERQVRDPELRRLLTPDYTIGCKRIVPSNQWYPALQKPNVTLVPHALREIRENSVIDTDGVEHEVDTIIFATGFHVADVPFADRVRGRDGQLLADLWKGSPRAYLGTAVPGFPNYFMFLGPNTGLGHSSMIYMIESQIAHVTQAIRMLDKTGSASIEVDSEVHDAFNRLVDKKMTKTVWQLGGCTSFYQDATGRNATLWPDWTWRFRQRARRRSRAAYWLEPARAGARVARFT